MSEMNRKKVCVGLLAILLSALFLAACGAEEAAPPPGISASEDSAAGEAGAFGSASDGFLALVKTGEYRSAVAFYETEILGNAVLEREAEDALEAYCRQIGADLFANVCNTAEAETALTTVGRVAESTGLLDDAYDALARDVQAAAASKAAFSAAEELKALSNYADAIVSYREVLEADADYAAAQAGASECARLWKEKTFAETAKLAENKQYPEAIALLDRISAVLDGDSELSAKRTVYVKSHISAALADARALFVTPAADYKKALEAINAVLQYYPEDAELNAGKAYYASFEPVALYDLEPYNGELDLSSSDTDIFGTKYDKTFTHYGASSCSATYDIAKRYNRFTATVYSRETNNKTVYHTLIICGDGVKLYENNRIADNGRAFTIDLDVTGVTDLQISFDGGSWSSSGIGLADVLLQRTAK